MPLAAQHGADSQGSCGGAPTANISPVSKTYIEGALATVKTSSHPNHPPPIPYPSHARNTTGGSGKTYIEGNEAGREGDAIACGDKLGTNATKTFIG